MRLGGGCFGDASEPDAWVAAMKRLGYSAAYCPVRDADEDTIQAFADAAKAADIVIAEVGAFGNNPISPDEDTRRQGIAKCQERLALADAIGARCCVNVAGSRGERWAGPDPDNLSQATFDLVVESVREIIDGVNPSRSFYTLETMPWVFPHTVDSFLRLVEAVDRKAFAVHFDPVNMICSPEVYFDNASLLREGVAKLGPHIRSCHAKDILLADKLTVHLDEVRPGLGALDYAVFLKELDKLDPDTPLMIEHLKGEEEFRLAADHIRSVAGQVGVAIR